MSTAPPDAPEAEPPGPRRSRRRWLWTTAAIVFAVLYGGLIVAYSIGGNRPVDQRAVVTPPGGVAVVLTARTIDALTPAMAADVQLEVDDSLLGDDGAPTEPITISLEPTQDDQDLTYGTDRRLPVKQVKLLFDGDIQNWPFDNYETPIAAFATVGDAASARSVPTVVILDGSVQGWQLAADTDPDVPDLLTDVTFHRSLAIVLFGLALVTVLVMLPITCWIVGIKLYREDRLFEAGFLGWIAAMLFATIPIRGFFPGSPPPGSWVDVLVVLWVIIALTLALVVGLAAFISHPRRNH